MKYTFILLALLLACTPKQALVHDVIPTDSVKVEAVSKADTVYIQGKDSVRVDTMVVTNWKNKTETKYVTTVKMDTIDRKVTVIDTVFKNIQNGNPWGGIWILVGVITMLLVGVIFIKKPL
jgi:hypothetical protein